MECTTDIMYAIYFKKLDKTFQKQKYEGMNRQSVNPGERGITKGQTLTVKSVSSRIGEY